MKFVLLLGTCLVASQSHASIEHVKLPKGFTIEVFQDHIPDARSMALSPSGILFVGSRGSDGVRAIIHPKLYHGGIVPTGVITFGNDLTMPNGVAYRNGNLYVAELSRIVRFKNIEEQIRKKKFNYEIVMGDLPDKEQHGWKYLAFGPDGWLYFGIGAPCNICKSTNEKFASISRISEDGRKFEVFARGVRNSVGFDWDSKQQLYFTDNGRDLLGDDQPNDELNVASKSGLNFGYPFCHQGDIPDPEFGKDHDCSGFQMPHTKLGPHVAALGMKFYRGSQFPSTYRGLIFIAQHGSWNRSNKIGYRIVTVDPKKPGSMEVFADGWLESNQSVRGRPVDIIETPDSSLLISDDYAGQIYRISYKK